MVTSNIKAGGRSGVEVTYIKSRKLIRVGGWYDTMVGIEGFEKPLGEFLDELGVSGTDLLRVLRERADAKL